MGFGSVEAATENGHLMESWMRSWRNVETTIFYEKIIILLSKLFIECHTGQSCGNISSFCWFFLLPNMSVKFVFLLHIHYRWTWRLNYSVYLKSFENERTCSSCIEQTLVFFTMLLWCCFEDWLRTCVNIQSIAFLFEGVKNSHGCVLIFFFP